MMRLAAAAVLWSAAAVGAGLPDPGSCTVNRTLPTALVTNVKATGRQGVLARLKDAPSARFGDTRVVRLDCGDAYMVLVCGTVNAKNGFGGYTGYQGWLVDFGQPKGAPAIWTESDAAGDLSAPAWAWYRRCMADGR